MVGRCQPGEGPAALEQRVHEWRSSDELANAVVHGALGLEAGLAPFPKLPLSYIVISAACMCPGVYVVYPHVVYPPGMPCRRVPAGRERVYKARLHL